MYFNTIYLYVFSKYIFQLIWISTDFNIFISTHFDVFQRVISTLFQPFSGLKYVEIRNLFQRYFNDILTPGFTDVEMLQTPEEPLQFTLLNKAENLLETIDSILREHNPTEDDTAPDLIPAVTTTLFLTALVEYHAAWTDWSAYDAAILDARIEAGLQRLRGGLVDTGVISG